MFKNLKEKELKESALPLARWIKSRSNKATFISGINGPPGCGKTTLALNIKKELQKEGKKALSLSIDDFYWTFKKRQKEARSKKLLEVRGPGTHDIKLAQKTLKNLIQATPSDITPIPRFNKWLKEGRGDRAPEKEWYNFKGQPDFIIFEGWNLLENPVSPKELEKPFNRIEMLKDPKGNSRKFINCRLKKDYPSLWKYIDSLIMIKPENITDIYEQRLQQEKALRAEGKEAMSDEQVNIFLDHYQRWIKHIQDTLYPKSDIVIKIDRKRKIKGVTYE